MVYLSDGVEYYSTTELRTILGKHLGRKGPVSYDMVYRYRDKGKLTPHELPGSNERWYPKSQVDVLLKVQPVEQPTTL